MSSKQRRKSRSTPEASSRPVLRSVPGLRAAHGDRDRLREAALVRYRTLVERLIDSAPAQAVEDALAASDDVGGLAGLLAKVGPLAPPARDPLAAARARGAQAKAVLLERAGGGLSAGAVAALMGVKPAAVHARRARGTLLAVAQANGEFVYPAGQFGPDGPLRGLGRVLSAFRVDGPWTRLSALVAPADALGGVSPLDALVRGNVEGAVEAVAGYGEQSG
ncbi:hypothetical protein [Longimicrobium sp.]|uniref:hypothetical protein n=1 Tax=Longimicrobium sp. TaxID=2029185 RepID=UPI002CEED1AB|nr:hypothetical protein [Longimicrobium sp.]HSU15306.1 hypothetical protein [Longimicrobium sp.]